MVLQESVLVPDSVRADVQKEEGKLSSIEKVNPMPPVYSHQPLIPYPQKLAWVKLFQLEPKFARFLEVLKQLYVDTPFLEALKKVPAYMQFVRDFLFKKGEHKGGLVMPIGRVRNSIL